MQEKDKMLITCLFFLFPQCLSKARFLEVVKTRDILIKVSVLTLSHARCGCLTFSAFPIKLVEAETVFERHAVSFISFLIYATFVRHLKHAEYFRENGV